MTRLRSRKIHWAPTLSVLLCLAMLTGCNSVDPFSATAPSPELFEKDTPVPMDALPFTFEYIDQLWNDSNHDDWDVLTGVVDPVAGTRLSGVPQSWPDEYIFRAAFPPNCLDSTEPFTFSIYIPRFTEGDLHPPVYLLEPHGLEFTLPVTLEFCFPPWYEENEAYAKFHFWREEEPPQAVSGIVPFPEGEVDPEPIYRVSDYERVNPSEENLRLGLEFETLHFSRWGLSNGNGGGNYLTIDPDPIPPNIKR